MALLLDHDGKLKLSHMVVDQRVTFQHSFIRLVKKFEILKHWPCTVVGWELSQQDKAVSQDGERMLHLMPACICIKFEEAA